MEGNATAIGTRIQVVGRTCTGKSTLGEALARRLGLPFVELDALFWRPNWQEPSEEEFAAQLREATAGDAWVVAGNYGRHTIPLYWNRLETVVWLDFPLRQLPWAVLKRSWMRSRRNELLWGTNYERFWPQLKLWNTKDSLIAFAFKNRKRSTQRFLDAMGDPAFAHIRWVRLKNRKQVREWLASVTNGERRTSSDA